ncbi:MAG: M3 family metallopeptidase [Burkholderiales bacterium]|nr:M3 family metallopeptidase [Burkholderiales bacterium]
MHNPLLAPWNAPYGLPPFAATQPEHFAPAFEAAFAEHRAELDAIARNPEPATFANTIAAFDRAGWKFVRINEMFGNLAAAHTSPALEAAERDLAPKIATHQSAVYMNQALFARIDRVLNSIEGASLSAEDRRLAERIHLDFVRQGARIATDQRERYAAIVGELASLSTQFSQNVLKDETDWVLWLDDESSRAGLPADVLNAARAAAAERGRADGYAITLSRSSVVPFLTFSTRRDLRKIAFDAWVSRGAHDGPTDNRQLIVAILKLRQEQAALHGYATFADFQLVDRMAKTPEAARALMLQAWEPAKATLGREAALLNASRIAHDQREALEPWDWRFYEEKVRQSHFKLDDAAVKPYFELDRMIAAMFGVAGRLFGLSFKEVTQAPGIQLYHPDVRLFEVHREGQLKALFISDNFARSSKRGGAWMSSYRVQGRNSVHGEVIPIVGNHNNFAKAPAGQPNLISFDDVRTLFHEFGHGLHGMLSNVRYERLAGTNVYQDYVELPSQLMEHWATTTEVLTEYARHYQTGEPIPAALVERIQAASRFGSGFENVQYIASTLTDLALHSRSRFDGLDVMAFEQDALASIGMPREAHPMHRFTGFRHLFSDASYAAGYYVYMWAAVLDNDAFEAFEEAGDAFDVATAKRLHDYIYSAGSSIESADAYRAFRGRDANVEAMLRKRGLVATV